MNELLKLVLALLGFMGANILFGAVAANIQAEFNKLAFFNGIKKALAIATGFVLVYCAGLCVPDMKLIELGGQQLTTLEALTFLFNGGILIYGYKAFSNMFTLFKVDSGEMKELANDLGTLPEVTELDDETAVG